MAISESLSLKNQKNEKFFFFGKKFVISQCRVGRRNITATPKCLLTRNLFLSGSKTPALLSVPVFLFMGVFRYLGVFLVVFSQVAPEKHLIFLVAAMVFTWSPSRGVWIPYVN